MKTFLDRSNPNPLSRSKAWTCVVINQAAFPGMGTVMAGRRCGYLQAAIMLAGFFLTMGFMFCYFLALIRVVMHSESGDVRYLELLRPYAWAGISGLSLCFIAWCWSLVSSLAILRSASPT